jgi:glycerol-3-phosphate cytidylyltransferase
MIKVITYGTFDLFHYGHYNLLARAKQLGDYLVVGISTDEMCIEKNKKCILSFSKRMNIIENIKFVDMVIPEHTMGQKVLDIDKYNIDVFTLGSDYKNIFPSMKEYEIVNKTCSVVFLERTPDISTSLLKCTTLASDYTERLNSKSINNSLSNFRLV